MKQMFFYGENKGGCMGM